jgi:hypothetical protein
MYSIDGQHKIGLIDMQKPTAETSKEMSLLSFVLVSSRYGSLKNFHLVIKELCRQVDNTFELAVDCLSYQSFCLRRCGRADLGRHSGAVNLVLILDGDGKILLCGLALPSSCWLRGRDHSQIISY